LKDSLFGDWINYRDTGCPVTPAPRIAEFLRRKNRSITIDDSGIFK
jgi:hypothetical protein